MTLATPAKPRTCWQITYALTRTVNKLPYLTINRRHFVPKLTSACALISLAEFIDARECCSGSLWRCRPSQPPSIKVEENMLRAACGRQISLALAVILASAVVGLAFADVAQAGRDGGGFHGGGAAASLAAWVGASIAA